MIVETLIVYKDNLEIWNLLLNNFFFLEKLLIMWHYFEMMKSVLKIVFIMFLPFNTKFKLSTNININIGIIYIISNQYCKYRSSKKTWIHKENWNHIINGLNNTINDKMNNVNFKNYMTLTKLTDLGRIVNLN